MLTPSVQTLTLSTFSDCLFLHDNQDPIHCMHNFDLFKNIYVVYNKIIYKVAE